MLESICEYCRVLENITTYWKVLNSIRQALQAPNYAAAGSGKLEKGDSRVANDGKVIMVNAHAAL